MRCAQPFQRLLQRETADVQRHEGVGLHGLQQGDTLGAWPIRTPPSPRCPLQPPWLRRAGSAVSVPCASGCIRAVHKWQRTAVSLPCRRAQPAVAAASCAGRLPPVFADRRGCGDPQLDGHRASRRPAASQRLAGGKKFLGVPAVAGWREPAAAPQHKLRTCEFAVVFADTLGGATKPGRADKGLRSTATALHGGEQAAVHGRGMFPFRFRWQTGITPAGEGIGFEPTQMPHR